MTMYCFVSNSVYVGGQDSVQTNFSCSTAQLQYIPKVGHILTSGQSEPATLPAFNLLQDIFETDKMLAFRKVCWGNLFLFWILDVLIDSLFHALKAFPDILLLLFETLIMIHC